MHPRGKVIKNSISNLFWLRILNKKQHFCQNNPEKSGTERKAKHELSGWVMCTKCLFDETKTKRDYYRGTNCTKK